MNDTPRPIAVLDTNILLPPSLRDMFLYAAELGLFQPRWSTEILSELHRNLVKVAGLDENAATRRITIITRFFAAAVVQIEPGEEALHGIDIKDRHVLAAAIASGSGIIVTQNTRHFPQASLIPHGVVAWTADEFLMHLLQREPVGMMEAVRFHASKLRNPPMAPPDLLNRLALHAPEFARSVLEAL